MRYAPRAILAGGLGFAASFVVACGGGSGLLSGDQSNALSNQADQIGAAVQSGNCGAALNASAVLGSDVETLPVTLNSTLRSNLTQGATTIAELARKDCRHHTVSTASTPTSSSSTTTTTSTSTSTSTSTTTPTTTTSTSTTSSTATTPPDTGSTSTTTGGVGLGGGTTSTSGNGNGNGNGSGGTGPGQGDNSGTGGGG
jgi:Tfp pilus assembly protein PilE